MSEALKIAAAKLWPAYGVYSSNGATNVVFERHVWPVIKEIRKALREDPPAETENEFLARLSEALYSLINDLFDMSLIDVRLGRPWGLLPQTVKDEWFESASKLMDRMVKADSNAEPILYAAGFEDADGNYGMYAGPHPRLSYIRDFDPPPGTKRPAFILELRGDVTKKLERWDSSDFTWKPVEP